jgi:hypothetical protein
LSFAQEIQDGATAYLIESVFDEALGKRFSSLTAAAVSQLAFAWNLKPFVSAQANYMALSDAVKLVRGARKAVTIAEREAIAADTA